MAVNFTTLFTQLGKIGGTLLAVNTSRGTTIPAAVDVIYDQFTTTLAYLLDQLYPTLENYQAACEIEPQYLQALAQGVTIATVENDTPLNALQITEALVVLIRQMIAAEYYITPPSVSFGSPSYGATNRGNGVLVGTVTDALGQLVVNCYDETVSLVCTSDASLGATNYNEPFQVTTPLERDALSWLWPTNSGSGVNFSLNSVDPQEDNAAGQLLTNGDFEDWAANDPVQWDILVGTAGNDILAGTEANSYAGTACLRFRQYSGSPLSQITQTFDDDTNGTAGALLPDTCYAIVLHAKKETGLSGAGTIRIAFLDASDDSIMTDDEGNNLSYTFTAASLSTSYTTLTTVFRTPRAMPADGVKMSVGLSVALADANLSVWIDWLSVSVMTRLYTGGPLIALVSGESPWAVGDTSEVAIENDYAGDWVMMTERLFALREKELYIPTSGSYLINDSLINTTP